MEEWVSACAQTSQEFLPRRSRRKQQGLYWSREEGREKLRNFHKWVLETLWRNLFLHMEREMPQKQALSHNFSFGKIQVSVVFEMHGILMMMQLNRLLTTAKRPNT